MKNVMIVGAILLGAAAAAAGGFWGGMAYTANREEQARANFTAARGQAAEGQFPGDPGPGGFSGGELPGGQALGSFGGGGTNGQVKSIEGNVLTLSTAEDVTTVTLSESTQIQLTVTGDLSDLEPGMRVLVIGAEDSDGVIAASRISILDSDLFDAADPSGTGTEP